MEIVETPSLEGTSAGGSGGRASRYLLERLREMHPAYFAMSMATGIVSIACDLLGMDELSVLLFWVNVGAYAALWLATLARLVRFPGPFFADWGSHQRGPGFFTSVAATGVLGSQFALLRGQPEIGLVLWFVALVLWILCTYAIFVSLSIREVKPSLDQGINGGWLVAVVATQSLCVLGCAVLPQWTSHREAALFALTCFWLCGGMLYIWMISLIFYRYTFFRFAPSDLMPPYWINMGAVAISTLAGTALLSVSEGSPFMASILPFVRGFTALYWATATWWIPMLLILGIWRHGVRRFRFRYDPLYWGLVFPLGMYSVCTYRMAQTMDLPYLAWIPRGFVFAAVVAWLFTFSGLVTRALYVGLLLTRTRAAAPAARDPWHARLVPSERPAPTHTHPGGSP